MDEDTKLLSFFRFDHLPERLQVVSRPFYQLVVQILQEVPKCTERTFALRKLLESKDCTVRAKL